MSERGKIVLSSTAALAFLAQLAQMITIFVSRNQHNETAVMYTTVVVYAVVIGFNACLLAEYLKFARMPKLGGTLTISQSGRHDTASTSIDTKIDIAERLRGWHANMMYMPAKISFVGGACYFSALFSLMHYYRTLVDNEIAPATAPTGPCSGPCDDW
eukprot:SAG31_NODE_5968_length_2234_cov_1.716159_3_plen_158_part_00